MTAPRTVPSLRWPSGAGLTMPGSKSAANRLLVAAAVSGHEVLVTGATASDDVRHLVAGLAALGYQAALDSDRSTVRVGPRRANAPSHGTLFCGNAGTALRFLVSVAAITPGTWTITGDTAMQRRPIGPLVQTWCQLGVDMRAPTGCPPVQVTTRGKPRGGAVQLDASMSSQFVSSLLLVGSSLAEGLQVTWGGQLASADYVALTCHALGQMAISARHDDHGARVLPRSQPPPSQIAVAGDWSSMGVWTCLDYLTGSRVCAHDLTSESQQADEALSAVLQSLPRHGDVAIDVSRLPDQFLNLAIVAAHRHGTTRLRGGHNLRIKECDRIAVMARELGKVGVAVSELPDGLLVHGGQPLRAATIDPERDHRVAIAFALAGLLSPGIAIADPDCVTKSYPTFWRDLDMVVATRAPIALVGMRGAGKTTLARALARQLDAPLVDCDELFVARHGDIGEFVAANGWPAFRALEEQVLAANLRPGVVMATGGGAIESAATRRILRERAVAVWLDPPLEVLRRRLSDSAKPRPSLTGAPIAAELAAVAERRRDGYAEVAALRLDGSQPIADSVAQVLRELTGRCRWPST